MVLALYHFNGNTQNAIFSTAGGGGFCEQTFLNFNLSEVVHKDGLGSDSVAMTHNALCVAAVFCVLSMACYLKTQHSKGYNKLQYFCTAFSQYCIYATNSAPPATN